MTRGPSHSIGIKALAAAHAALQQTAAIGHVATLASVVLLGIFENMTSKRAGSTQWTCHVDGAIQVLRAIKHRERPKSADHYQKPITNCVYLVPELLLTQINASC
ncbi:hypothetical protein MAJ_08419, partial [Metarhizium majus ARSEF 297]